ncbi:MAG: type II toxin-antitoxin system RelE/ParE family toxin [Actinobacteria bacterium]|nr:type II toxin-antitoxin system RelE/ParE family toxin [Actinomycetota bacterium]
MAYEIVYAPSAAKALRKLDRQVARRLLEAISKLAEEPRSAGGVQLVGGEGELRIRVGDYRVVYDVIDEEVVVLILRLGHRREIYR